FLLPSSSIGFTALRRGDRFGQMQCGVFCYAGAVRWRYVNYQMIRRFGGKRRGRRRCGDLCLRLPFLEWRQPPADENAIDDESDSDQYRDYSDHPQASNDICRVPGFLRHDVEEEVEKDHQADACEAGDDAALDLIEPSLFRRATHPLP